jgi:hypothetical protein
LELIDGYPRLDAGFESSLPGLHFLGAPAAWSFGPLMRFVAGTEFVSPALTKRIREVTKRSLVSQSGLNSFALELPGAEPNPAHTSSGAGYLPPQGR